MATVARLASRPMRLKPARDEMIMRAMIVLLGLWLIVTVALPLWVLLQKSFQNANGEFVGLANYARYVSTPSLLASFWNSLFIAAITTAIVIPLAFTYAYALTRSRMPFKPVFRTISMVPLLAPSLL